MGISVSRQTTALIATVVIVAIGLLVFLRPARPKVAAAGPESGIAAACGPGSRTGHPDLADNLQTSDRLTLAVRTPSNYDPTRAYQLLFVYPPAGYNRRQSETFYDLTTEATRRDFIVAYSDHIGLSPTAVAQQAKVAATVASFFYVDEASIAYLGHSDGGLMAEGIPAYVPKASAAPHSIVASAAGITGDDLATMACPSIPAVMIVHSRADERFPDFGRGTAAYWGRCAACAPENLNALASGCRDFKRCAGGRRVTYCETSMPHKHWPSMNIAMLDFIQGGKAKRTRRIQAILLQNFATFIKGAKGGGRGTCTLGAMAGNPRPALCYPLAKAPIQWGPFLISYFRQDIANLRLTVNEL